MFVGDERVAVVQADGGPRRGDFAGPDGLEVFVVLDHFVHHQEGGEVGAFGRHADAAELRVNGLRIGQTLGGKCVFNLHRAGLLVDDHQFRGEAIPDQQDLV